MSTEELRKAVDVAARLDALMPELEFSRETHVQWRDCEQRFRDANPSIGSAEFHASAVRDYDERIAAIKQAAQALRDQEAEIARYRRNLQAYVDNGWTLPAPMIRDLLNGTEILTAHLGANND